MSNISGRINLAALESAIIKTKSGDEAIVIPIKKNNLFKSDKGNVYLDLSAKEAVKEEYKQTHVVSQSLAKDVYDAVRANGEYPPTLGNLTDWSKLNRGEPYPNQGTGDSFEPESDGDLPF